MIRAQRFERETKLGIIPADAALSPTEGKWEEQPNKAWEARCMEVYAAQVAEMDAGIGRIVAALKDTNRLDNTLVLFLSDNGGCAEKMGREATTTTKPAHPTATRDGRRIRDGKEVMPGHFVHEGGISTPLIAHWPKVIARQGELERQPGHITDLMQTCVALSGAQYPREVNGHPTIPLVGVSLLPAFRGESLGRTSPIFWEHEGNRAVRIGPWKLVAKGAAF